VDVLEIELRPAEYGDEAHFRINGRPLLEMVREVEAPMAAAEGNPEIAGAYGPIPANLMMAPSRHLLEKPDPLYSDLVRSGRASKAAVLVCGDCGEPGCWPFCVRIVIDGDIVRWSDYEQPHRSSPDDASRWTYEALPEFAFDRAQYIAAIDEPMRSP
jgi:hypothetical protein